MSVLSKVFVVLVCILSVLLVALVVPFVANTENFRRKWEEEQRKRQAAETTARVQQGELNAVLEGENQRAAELRATVGQLTSQVSLLSEKLASTEAELAKERARIQKFEADVGRLAAAEEAHAAILKVQEEELKGRRDSDVAQKTRLIEQADRINELTSQVESMERAVRRVREEKTDMLQELTALRQRGPATGPARSDQRPLEAALPAHTIFGEITRVQRTSGGQTFVEVNVGSNAGVTERMRFLVHRGDKYLGDLVITLVDEQEAAGVLERPQGQIEVGDRVQAGKS